MADERSSQRSAHFAISDGAVSKNFGLSYTKESDSKATVKNLPVFRAGTFADSWGYIETWSRDHLAMMVSNFTLLREKFPNVPVRQDHSRSIKDVVGYITDLRIDGDVLLADFELTRPEAISAWEGGTYRSRSAEIGYYEDNSQAGYWPCFVGFAFVDIPAVEHLYSKSNTSNPVHIFTEALVETETNTKTESKTEDSDATVTDPSKEGVANHSKTETQGTPVTQPVVFTYNGQQIADPKEVQAALDAAAEFARQVTVANRSSWVDELVASNKFAAPQADQLKAFATGLRPEQFEELQSVFSGVAVSPLLAKHTGDTGSDGAEGDATTAQFETDLEIVNQHRRASMPVESIKAGASYQRLLAAGKAPF